MQVFNLSITSPEIINETHERMKNIITKMEGHGKEEMMPRTIMVFINDEEGLTFEEK